MSLHPRIAQLVEQQFLLGEIPGFVDEPNGSNGFADDVAVAILGRSKSITRWEPTGGGGPEIV